MPKINDKLRIIKNEKQREREATYEARLKANNEDRPKCWLTALKRCPLWSRGRGGCQQAPGCSHLFDYKPAERSDNGVSRERERGGTERARERKQRSCLACLPCKRAKFLEGHRKRDEKIFAIHFVENLRELI